MGGGGLLFGSKCKPLVSTLIFYVSVEIAILCWMKFYTFESHTVAWVSTALMIPIICIFIAFAAHFYLKVTMPLRTNPEINQLNGRLNDLFYFCFTFSVAQLVSHKTEVYEHNLKELELLKNQLNAENSSDVEDVHSHTESVKII
jgi:hypothetical protein